MNTPTSRPGIRILVVEDSVDDYELLIRRLKALPFAVETRRVEDGPGMSAALAESPWDLVISDHHLPRFSSAAALALLRSSHPDIPFIIVSGVMGEDAAVEALQAGADDYLMKSNMRRLVPAIERCLQMAGERRAKRTAEEAARASERRFAAVSANIPGLVLRIEYDVAARRITFPWASEGAHALCGHSPERLTADPSLLFACIEPDDAEALRAAIADAGESHGSLRWEGRVKAPGEERRWWLLAATPDRPGDGRQAWYGILTDITPEHRAREELAESRERLSELAAHIESTKETERAAISREIHDEMGGLLTGLKADVAWLKKHWHPEGDAAAKIQDIETLLDEVVQVSRRIAKSLRPAILDQGLTAALEWQASEFEKHAGIPCRFRTNKEDFKMGVGEATGVFRVFQEALTNVAKHSHAKHVDVQMFATEDLVTLEVHDDGVGLRPQDLAKPDSFGVRGMQERVHRLGGWLDVNGAPGRGTTLMLSIPRTDGPEEPPS